MSALNQGVLIVFLVGHWITHFAQRLYGMPVDIFEYFRKEESTQDLPVEP